MSTTVALPRRRPAPIAALQVQAGLLRLALNSLLFLCGLCAWAFKLKGDGSAEGGLLPYSPLQLLLPLLGVVSLLWLFVGSRGRLPQLMVPQPSAWFFQAGIALVLCGAVLHFRGAYAKEAAIYFVRWMLPAFFLLFLTLARGYGGSPLALICGIFCGAFVSAVSVEAYRSLGVNLPVTTPLWGRYSGYLSHPNQYGILCSTTAPFILYLFYAEYGRAWVGSLARLVAVALVPLYLVCLFQNLSKTNIILFFLALLGASLVLSVKNPRKMIGTVALAVGLAVFLVLTVGVAMNTLQNFSPKAVKVLEDAISNPTEAKSVSDRGEIWAEAIRIIKSRPLIGLGPGKSLDALGIAHAHNVLLQMYLDAGLAGFIGILCVFVGVFARTWELIRFEIRTSSPIDNDRMLRVLSCVAMVTYIFANSMSDSFSTATMPPFIFFAALAFVPVRKTAPAAETARRTPQPALRRFNRQRA